MIEPIAGSDTPDTPAAQAKSSPIVYAALHEIDGDPNNVRQGLPNITALALSIAEYGLLENLVAVRVPEPERKDPDCHLQLRAGSRRYEALRQLIEHGVKGADGVVRHLPEMHPIPVLVLDSDGVWENLVENVQRVDLKPWDVGRRLSEMSNSGSDLREIGIRVGKSAGWVGRHVAIGRGLHPLAIAYITEKKVQYKLGQLQRLAGIVDQFGDPDGAAQVAALQQAGKKRAPKKRLDAAGVEAIANRVRYMENDMPIPPVLRPCVSAIIEYLKGGASPNFRRLQRQFLETQRLAQGQE